MQKILLMIVAVVLVGCGSSIRQIRSVPLPNVLVDDKNYEIGKTKTVNVGDRMIVRKKYLVNRWIRRDIVVPSNDCVVRASAFTGYKSETRFKRGGGFRAIGEITFKESDYVLIPINGWGNTVLRAAIHSETHTALESHIHANGNMFTKGFELSVDPPNTKFKPYIEEVVDISKESPEYRQAVGKARSPFYINYDITYTGSSNNQISMVYREYDREDFARTAFYQNLTYQIDNGKAKIRFRDIAMDVQKVGNQSITFVVTGDDSTIKPDSISK